MAYSTTSALRPRVVFRVLEGLRASWVERIWWRKPPEVPASEACFRWYFGKRKEESVGSGNAGWEIGVRGRAGKLIPRVSASIITSRAVMTQSTSRTGWAGALDDGGRQ